MRRVGTGYWVLGSWFWCAACGDGGTKRHTDPCFLGECDAGPGHDCETVEDCADPDLPCVVWECREGACYATEDPLDLDGDEHGAAACGGDDCDDADPRVPSPGGEFCNHLDDDCDGLVDEGFVVDAEDQRISDDLAATVTLAAVYEGSGYGVFWARETTWDLTFQLLDADGRTLGEAQPVSGQMDPARPGRLALVGIPGGFFAAWGQDGRIGFSQIALESGPDVPGVIETGASSAYHVTGAYSGATIGLGWIEIASGRYPTWAIVDTSGSLVVDPTQTQRNTTPDTVGMEWLGDRYALLFEGVWGATGDGGKILFIDEDGTQSGPAEFTDLDASSPVAAREGDTLHVLWNERKPVGLFYRATTPDGAALTNAVQVASAGYVPDVASAGSGTLAAWLSGFDMATGWFGVLEAAVVGTSIADVPIDEPADVDVLRPMDDSAGLAGPPSLVADEGGGFAIAFAARDGGIFFDRIDCE